MIGRLRKKFIVAAILAVFLVLLLLIGSINLLNYRSMVAEADETLQILSANNGLFPRQMFREEDFPKDWYSTPNQQFPPPAEGRNRPFDARHGENRELAYQSRYFAAWFDADGSCVRVNTDNLASLTEEEAAAFAETVYSSGREKGFSGEYRFCRTVCDGEIIGISLAGILAVFLLLLLFSARIVRPIAESYEKQKRFITDAGHELKTPITIIQADADVLESELEEESEWIADIRKQTHRLAELTSDLIYLSKMEEENSGIRTQEFSISELAEETARSFQALALSQGKQFHSSVEPGLSINGDEKAVAKLVSILLDNAMKYSPEGGTVELSLDIFSRNARLTVKNSTLPMEKGNADRLFERFARADSSRNSESGGFGLGLAIAKAVTEVHKGKIHAESEDGASLTVTAELPLA